MSFKVLHGPAMLGPFGAVQTPMNLLSMLTDPAPAANPNLQYAQVLDHRQEGGADYSCQEGQGAQVTSHVHRGLGGLPVQRQPQRQHQNVGRSGMVSLP